MQRVTEPELMLAPDQVQAYAEADFSSSEASMLSEVDLLIRDRGMHIDRKKLIVDLGCGPGNITQRLADQWPEAKVLGLDDSPEMLMYARKKQKEKISFLERITYKKINISQIANGDFPFRECADLVVSNSLIHHIHDPLIFIKALKNISKHGAIHFHRDLRRPSSLEEALAIKQKHLPTAPSVMEKDFIASLKAAYTSREISQYLKDSELNSFKVVEVDDRYLDVFGVII
ncbi:MULTISPECIES: class I SAM-dependent methyltransferase [Prochlorococcus]|uniref:SAM-dependent methyltransferase n=2 Tax=Prochlorococcus marinus TaxID=1219 RepID=Q7VCC5_PROMA|nr:MULTISPECIES: class I SAM-dependent methyltransferase [Prochlorococcus]AAP99860.1 SAM-dependent methyltransferase [Prochlorococcus marinus subsp. marinus str. CCMP1375]KGG18793.1 SAM-dependent methyltransferase [Prochlorococcus marinus str. SS2]KGG23669.1 SAM-dependent methyltransferase [Prochlorococcus marinus str. SS35]KGG32095.1 SAM-dependent methyltransferase [Prochlorococcus marinus str. SS51]KGG35214.1 SAM-dependent methyltransferase [Prochlorococcus sp. SS52]